MQDSCGEKPLLPRTILAAFLILKARIAVHYWAGMHTEYGEGARGVTVHFLAADSLVALSGGVFGLFEGRSNQRPRADNVCGLRSTLFRAHSSLTAGRILLCLKDPVQAGWGSDQGQMRKCLGKNYADPPDQVPLNSGPNDWHIPKSFSNNNWAFSKSPERARHSINGSGSIPGQARCLRHEVIPFRDARRPGSRDSVVFDGGFVVSRLFQQMGANSIETIVIGKTRVGIERS